MFTVVQAQEQMPLDRERSLVEALGAVHQGDYAAAADLLAPLVTRAPAFPAAEYLYSEVSNARVPLGSLDGLPSSGPYDEFVAEVTARFTAHRNVDYWVLKPNLLMRPSESQRNAIVVDLSRNRLFLFERQGDEFVLVRHVYASTGAGGAHKVREGDQRAPIGVYFLTERVPDRDLPARYGAGALPINYPNEWDMRQGRTGYGIWLHGVPRDVYSRGPRSTEGCIAVSNDVLSALWFQLEPVSTPVIIAEHLDWVTREEVEAAEDEVLKAVEAWRRDWERLNADGLADHYADDFDGDRTARPPGLQSRQSGDSNATSARVRLARLSVFGYPNENDLVVVTFSVDNLSDHRSSSDYVRQYWRRNNDGVWRIVHEGPVQFLPIHDRGIPQRHEHLAVLDQFRTSEVLPQLAERQATSRTRNNGPE